MGFHRAELALVGTSAALVFSRVFGLSLVLANFRGHYEGLGFSGLWIGIALGAHGLTMALMQLPMGILSDRFGRRSLLLLSSFFFIGGSVAAAYAQTSETLVAARFLQGMGAVASIAVAAVGEAIPAERRTQAMAMVGIPAGAGFLAGMASGPILYPLIGMAGLFWVVAAVGALAMIPLAGIRFAPPVIVAPSPLGKPVWALAAAGFMLNYLLYTLLFFLPTSDWRVLLPLLTIALVVVGGASRGIDKAGLTWQPVVIGLLVVTAAAPFFSLAPAPGMWIAGAVFFSTHAILSTVIPSQVSRIAGARGGRGHGIQNAISYGGTFAGGAMAGYFALGPITAFASAAILATVAVAYLWWVTERPMTSH